MSNTNRQEEAMKEWQDERSKKARVVTLRRLIQEAGLNTEFLHVPDIKLETMDIDKYMITIMALGKIKALHELVQLQPV